MVPPSLDLLGRCALDPRPRSSRSARDDLARQHPRRDLGCTSSHPPSPAPLGRRHLRRVSAAIHAVVLAPTGRRPHCGGRHPRMHVCLCTYAAPLWRRRFRRVSAADSSCCSCARLPPLALQRSWSALAPLSVFCCRPHCSSRCLRFAPPCCSALRSCLLRFASRLSSVCVG